MQVVEHAGASPELTKVIIQLGARRRELQQQLPACQFCSTQLLPLIEQDMGGGRTLLLCTECQGRIAAGRAAQASNSL